MLEAEIWTFFFVIFQEACVLQVPPITDYNMTGHTYRYFAEGEEPLYPFGYGLSYSSFHYQKLSVVPTSVKAGQNVTVTVQVLNRGPYDADEVRHSFHFDPEPSNSLFAV